jgi:fibronectin type 3 domain-containing protein
VAGEGTSSNTVSVTPRPSTTITAPSPPQSLTATKPKSSPGIVLSWAAPASDGGSPITSYFVYRRGPGETAFTLIDLTATRTYTDTGVSPRTQYTYVVTAFNTYYESGYSNQVTIRTR